MEIEKFKDDLKNLGKRVTQLKNNIETEEATKTSLIMPFFQILGYDIFNPLEFIPEFTADVGIKKGEKVDYAILVNSIPTILIEAKSIAENLTKHDSQLFRYFGTTTSKFGILTNGKEYKFFTDLEEPNKMDVSPFLTFDITDLKENQMPEIAKFHKDNFDIDTITSSASELKYLNKIKEYLNTQLSEPDESFVKYFVGEIYDGMKTRQTIDKFTPLIKKGLNQFITEKVNDKLSAALNTSVSTKDEEEIISTEEIVDEIVTTPEELEIFTLSKLLLKDLVTVDRVYFRDNKSYFNVLLDDNIRKWILRFYMNKNGMKIEFNDGTKVLVEISNPLDITNHTDKIIKIVNELLKE